MKPNKIIMVHFGELWLKGKNRSDYIRTLIKNINAQLKGSDFTIEKKYDRLLISSRKNKDIKKIKEKLSHVFGISNYEIVYLTKPNLKEIAKKSKELLKERKDIKVLKVDAHRSYKELDFNSIDIVKSVSKVANDLGIDNNYKGFDSQIHISVTKENAYMSLDKTNALRGLPVGTSGKGVVLLSGGIDSPVAAWYAMKRGVIPVYVHIHPFPTNREASSSKVTDIMKILSSYHPKYKAYLIPGSYFQVKAAKSGKFELILLKAFMLRIAEEIAKREGANLIFTGESLGQVASQTPENLLAEELGIGLPILRPLIGMDKEEIIRIAKTIGTYDESIREYTDICSINARNPPTRTKKEVIAVLYKEIGLDKIVEKSLKLAKIIEE